MNPNSQLTSERPSRVSSPLLDNASAAKYLHMDVRNLNIVRCRGGGPKFIKSGRKVLYRQSALDDWLNAREFGSTSEAKRAGIR